MARSSTRTLLVLLAVVVAISAAASPASAADVAGICKGTAYPELCVAMAGKQAGGATPVDALAVLNMQVDAFEIHAAKAKAHVVELSAAPTTTPKAKEALDLCGNLYGDVLDTLGAAKRAIVFKDAVTIRAMMSMAAQDMQGCDEKFRQVGENNPLTHFDQSLLNLSENCRYLSNMI
ncbi:uncharacterized protein LOC100844869 [Brachypodium distachyon]|uniref:Pectinesterase inhibitor domain-containing protein n=1 Tax=Brachypodium distachyon TaxID=15368 RepID=I1HDY8_BRADI|nr:uncharacterized protein LOC100844869 [Brachypodium distachyon]KQK03623.1 hypothetical protein BRADI_2g08950v3 [Brachypodium distachyon]|eukprot:XP_003566396.1 uncharacterized protein LOC100844869 [Brachypodium distachyon]